MLALGYDEIGLRPKIEIPTCVSTTGACASPILRTYGIDETRGFSHYLGNSRRVVVGYVLAGKEVKALSINERGNRRRIGVTNVG